MRVIFFGTPLFSAHILSHLLQHGIDICAVISKPDRPKGRSSIPIPTPVKTVALSFNLPIYQPEIVSSLDFAPILQSYHADLFVVVAYGELIKQHLLDMPRIACINLHTSLLPKYRGAAPIQRSIIEGETETGVTFIHMVKKMDAGNIIRQIRIPIDSMTTFGELEESLCNISKEELVRLIGDFEKAYIAGIPQDSSQVTFAPKIELEDCSIDWNQPAQKIHNLIRGVNPYPGAWCNLTIQGAKKRLKIYKSKVITYSSASPGPIYPQKGNVIMATGDQALELIQVQLEGKKAMSSEELLRGLPFSAISWM